MQSILEQSIEDVLIRPDFHIEDLEDLDEKEFVHFMSNKDDFNWSFKNSMSYETNSIFSNETYEDFLFI
ncbi:MAG: hypothetical protein MRY83_22815 [Flavobacteriales bacterium]|nr:hypothetical protein [Flavobacteriales bacterium]